MKINTKIIVFFLFVLGFSLPVLGQVQFKITALEDGAYKVSLISSETYQSTQAMTATAQVTIRTLAGTMEPISVNSMADGVAWEANSIYRSPEEAPEYDYFSFGLTTLGTMGILYEAGEEIELFTFKNAATCEGDIEIINNETDPFLPPNSRSANIGNEITILGANGNAYIGNDGEGKAECLSTSLREFRNELGDIFTIFPNPVAHTVYLNFDWVREGEEVQLILRDIRGAIVKEASVEIQRGENQFRLPVADVAAGMYSVDLIARDWTVQIDKVVKVRE